MADIKKRAGRESWEATRRNSSSCKTKVRVRVSAIIVLAGVAGDFSSAADNKTK